MNFKFFIQIAVNKTNGVTEVPRFDDLSWQMTGEYEIISSNRFQDVNELNHKQMQQLLKFLKSQEAEEDIGGSVKMMDYVLSARESVHEVSHHITFIHYCIATNEIHSAPKPKDRTCNVIHRNADFKFYQSRES